MMSIESESNNTRTNANAYTLGDIMRGKITTANDVDCYKVALRPGHVKFKFTVPNGKNYRIRVFKGDNSNAITETVDAETTKTDRSCEADIPSGNDEYFIVISFNPVNTTYGTAYYSLQVYYTSISLPVIINQGHYAALSKRCANTASLDISFYYKDVIAAVTETEVNAMVSSYASNNFDAMLYTSYDITNKDASLDESPVYAKAVEQIKLGRPMMIHYYDQSVYVPGNNSHWVVAIGYNETNGNIDNLIVADPTTSNDTLSYTNAAWTLSKSRDWNMKNASTYYYGYVTTNKN